MPQEFLNGAEKLLALESGFVIKGRLAVLHREVGEVHQAKEALGNRDTSIPKPLKKLLQIVDPRVVTDYKRKPTLDSLLNGLLRLKPDDLVGEVVGGTNHGAQSAKVSVRDAEHAPSFLNVAHRGPSPP